METKAPGASPELADLEKPAAVTEAPATTAPGSLPEKAEHNFSDRAAAAKTPAEMRALIDELSKPASQPPVNQDPPKTEEAPEKPAAEAEAPKVDEEVTPAKEEAKAEEPAKEPAKKEDGEEDEPLPEGEGEVTPVTGNRARIRLGTDDEVGRLAAAFKSRNRDWTLEQAVDAAKAKLGIKPKEQAVAAPGEPVKPKSDLPATVEAVDAKIAELEAEEIRAATALETEAGTRATQQIRKLMAHKDRLERQEEQAKTQAQQSYLEAFAQSETEAANIYDFVGKLDTPAGQRMKEIDEAMEKTGDETFHDPRKPLIIAQMVAKELLIAPKSAKKAVAAVKPVVPAAAPDPKKNALPAGGSRTASAPNPKPEITQKIEGIKTIADLNSVRKLVGLSH